MLLIRYGKKKFIYEKFIDIILINNEIYSKTNNNKKVITWAESLFSLIWEIYINIRYFEKGKEYKYFSCKWILIYMVL